MGNTYQEAIENSNIVSRTDINGIITFVNDEFCKISGYKRDELIGQNHNIVRHPDVASSDFENLWNTILDKKPYKATVKNQTKDKNSVYLNTTITPILNKQNEIEEFIAIRYDVTAQVKLKKSLEQKEKELKLLNDTLESRVKKQTKQLEALNSNLEQKVKTEIAKNEEKQKILFWQSRMASLGQMLGNIAHQWRQPLSELTLIMFNMKSASLKNDEQKVEKLYLQSKNVINSMSDTIENFMDFFNPKKEKVRFEIVDALNDALNILEKTIQKEQIDIKIDVKCKSRVLGISNELSQVIINLIQNSKDAFILKNIKRKNIKIIFYSKIYMDRSYSFLDIIDNAGGVHKRYQDNIFEPYFTTKHEIQGTGLGLFMSKMIIEKSLNGELFYNRVQDGSKFTIQIPMD